MATKHYSDGRIEELDADGKVIWEWPKDRAKPNPAQSTGQTEDGTVVWAGELGPEPVKAKKAAPKAKAKGKK